MRVLMISSWYPYPPDNGSRIRYWNLLQQLARRHDVTLLTFAQEPPDRAQLSAVEGLCRRVDVVPAQTFRPGSRRAIGGLLSLRPRHLVDTFSPIMAARVREAAMMGQDLVLACQIGAAPYALVAEGVPRVLDEVELSVIWEQYTRELRPLQRARYRLTWEKTARYVRRTLRDFDGWTVVSEAEGRLVETVAGSRERMAVVPNGLDLSLYPRNLVDPEPDTLIHSGALSYHANRDAVCFLVGEVLPRVAAQRPSVRLRMTGRVNEELLRGIPRHPAAAYTGYLEDVRPAVAASWASVVPLRVGGGTRLKVLEAMALGTPVVATHKGVEGLAVRAGGEALVADSAEDLAQAILQLLADRRLRDRLVTQGRDLVERAYDWSSIYGRLEEHMERAQHLGRHP